MEQTEQSLLKWEVEYKFDNASLVKRLPCEQETASVHTPGSLSFVLALTDSPPYPPSIMPIQVKIWGVLFIIAMGRGTIFPRLFWAVPEEEKDLRTDDRRRLN